MQAAIFGTASSERQRSFRALAHECAQSSPQQREEAQTEEESDLRSIDGEDTLLVVADLSSSLLEHKR